MRVFRVIGKQIGMDLRARTLFRTSFWLGLLSDLAWLITSVVFFDALFRHVPEVRGWTRAQVMVLVGTLQVVEGLFQAFLAPNLRRFPGYVRQGLLDRLLLYPVDLQVMISLGRGSPPGLLSAFVGFALVGHALPETGWTWEWKSVVLYGAGLFLALGMRYAVALFVESLALVWVRVDTLRSLAESFYAYGAYPADVLPTFFRGFFLLGIPLLWLANVPAEAFRHPERLVWLMPVPFLYGWLSRLWLKHLLKKYEGPG